MTKKYFSALCFNAIALLAALAVSGCAEEKFCFDDTDSGDGVALSFRPTDMLPQYTDAATEQSRAADPKTEEEKEIKTIHLFFFDAESGDLLEPLNGDVNFKPYQIIGGGKNLISIGADAFTQMQNVRVVAIVNIDATNDATHNYFCTEYTPEGAIRKDTRDPNDPSEFRITNYSDLKQWTYHPRLRTDEGRSISDLPAAGMPMIGESICDLIKSDTNPRIEIQLRALMARINISLKLTPDQTSADGALPTLRVTSYGIKNMPIEVPFVAPDAQVADPAISEDKNLNYNLTSGPMEEFEYDLPTTVIINKNSQPVTFSYYTYENIQLPNYNATHPNSRNPFFEKYASEGSTEAQYPDGVKDDARQRWKPLIAREEASALTLKGVYTTHQGVNYRAQFTIYMGANPENDFRVERNHEYNNNITIHGLDHVRTSTDDVYTFDARVNVTSDNPIYIAIVNERKIDAHATALPMDIWLLQQEPSKEIPHPTGNECTVTLSIPEEHRSWVTMAMVPREVMKPNFEAGTGVASYFYTDMITKCNSGELTYTDPAGNVGCRYWKYGPEISFTSTAENTKSRSRIYFYIDENVPTSANTQDSSYGDRICPVTLTYTDNATRVTYTRTIELEQRALVHVNGTHPSGDNIDTWMEYYEEYLEHNDPLDTHSAPDVYYEGLEWGLNGRAVRDVVQRGGWESQIRGTEVYLSDEAYRYTNAIINEVQNENGHAMKDLVLYSKPVSAFHYCFGRNKRNNDGSVTINETADGLANGGWYMPGIRELEVALTQCYLDFDDFRGNFYLSAACGKSTETSWWVYLELTDRARATKVIFKGDGTPDYEESNEGDPGSVLRTEPHRIRAFYRMKTN